MAAATYIIVTNASANTLSLEGDDRKPAVSIARAGTANINIVDVLGNTLLCDTLSAMVTAGIVTITRGGTAVTAAQLTAYKQGADMDRYDYDTDDDGVVDTAESMDATSRTAVTVAMSPYTVLATDTILQTASTTGVIGLTLPAGVDGKTYIVKDGSGSAGTNAVTITPDGAERIEGAATYVINSNYQAIELYYDSASTDWKVLDVAGFDPTTIETNTTRTGNWLAGNLPAQTDVNNGASPYTVLAADVQLNVLSTTGAVTLNLPAGVDGKTYTIKDEDGDAGTNTITITPDGAETIEGAANLTLLHNFDSVTLYYDATTHDWKVIHRVENNVVRGVNAAVDMVGVAAYPVNLDGGASRAFLLKEAIFVCTAGAALNGDVTVSLGTTPGGAEIMAATPLTGLDTANETFRVVLAGEMPAIAGNAALDCSVTIADTGGGATGTMTCYLIGEEV